jgi:hypothetical protein
MWGSERAQERAEKRCAEGGNPNGLKGRGLGRGEMSVGSSLDGASLSVSSSTMADRSRSLSFSCSDLVLQALEAPL